MNHSTISMDAIDYKHRESALSYLNYDINEGCLSVFLTASYPCEVTITLYSASIFSGMRKQVIYNKPVESGDLCITFRERVLSGFGAKCMVMHVNGKVYYMKRI
ncbi:hypothetical protein [Hufsiella ginkgonis]|uniref:Uncharacterized protein n=1 Tax=Hufsiella ginkgonis TaxID=2695274 RepID=A0A7K1XZA1_9SPHI|nr:hypothetical protein [Hufsiella ginkgonis]MXV16272.1 hypothetical protein [Hufsiella ginkgonis]